jgi:hypothetical protein
MISRWISLLIAIGFLAMFAGSLTLNLHGAIAVICAIGFSVFLSAFINERMRMLQWLKRMLGVFLLFVVIANLNTPHSKTQVFIGTVFVCGIAFLADPLVLWIVKRDDRKRGTPTPSPDVNGKTV